MVCKETAKMYLKVMNGFISLVGIVILAAGVYGLVELEAEIAALGEYAVYVPIAFGGTLLFVGLFGCYAASKQAKCMLLMYWVVMTAVTLGVLAVGAAVMVQIGALEDLEVGNSQAIVADGQSKINDVVLTVFESCCDVAVPLCSDDDSGSCISDADFASSLVISDEFCTALEQVEVDGVAVVGDDSCTAGAEVFMAVFTKVIEDNLTSIGITLIVLAVILLLVDIFTCCLICSNREDFDAEYRKQKQQQTGGAVAGTEGQGIKYT